MTNVLHEWLDLWNGDYAVADTLIADDFRLHAALMGGADDSAVNSPAALTEWIRQLRTLATDLHFEVQVSLADGDHLAVRWRCRGTYSGAMPGATAPAGTAIDFTGTDVLRTHDGRIAEYWVNSDVHVLLATLGVGARS